MRSMRSPFEFFYEISYRVLLSRKIFRLDLLSKKINRLLKNNCHTLTGNQGREEFN